MISLDNYMKMIHISVYHRLTMIRIGKDVVDEPMFVFL